jgi:eukaryotic-like serine/threonine-protein kinase
MIRFHGSSGLPPGTMIEGWEVIESLGSGGFGAVQKVAKNGQHYAIKIALQPEGTPDAKKTHARTLRELMCLLLLEHPNIVRVLSHGRWPDETGGHLYLVLEFIEGWTLDEWSERTYPTAHELIRVFEKVAAAVAYMHTRGVFHRDLKLNNVLIRKSDGEPVIIDFGAAAFAQAPDLTDAGLPPGTERFRAPEANRWWHANKKKPKARYDFRVTDELFAFGVMLHDALTDPRPTAERHRTAVNSVLLPPKDPQERNPRIPDALASLVRRLLARDLARRPESFEAVRRELAELLEHQGAEYRVPVHSPSAQVEHLSAARDAQRPEEAPVAKNLRPRKRLVIGGMVGAAALAAVGAVTAVTVGRGLGEPSSEAARQVVMQPQTAPRQSPDPMAPGDPPPAAAPPTTEVDPSPTVTATSQKEPDVKTTKSAPTPQQPPRFANQAQFLKWCRSSAIIGTLTAANAGCPGAQLRPERGDCPADAVKAMKEHGLKHRAAVLFTLGGWGDGRPLSLSPPLKSGKIEGTVIKHRDGQMGTPKLPAGTRLFGELWATPDKEKPQLAFVRFYRVQLPNGPAFPVCIVSSDDGQIGVEERLPTGEIRVGPAPWGEVVHWWP